MHDFLRYLFTSSLILSAFYLYYRWFLKHQLKAASLRILLLTSYASAIIIPFIHLDVIPQIPFSLPVLIPEQSFFHLPENEPLLVSSRPSFTIYIFVLYTLIASVICLRYLLFLGKIIRILQNSTIHKQKGTKVVISSNVNEPFAFANHVFLPVNPVTKGVLLHETAHVKQLHSLDLILGDVIKIFHWFNPASYLMYKDLKLIHECMADAYVLGQGISVTSYFREILNVSVKSNHLAFANYFQGRPFSFRISQLKNSKSKIRWVHYVVLLVLIVCSLGFVNRHNLMKFNINEQNLGSDSFQFPIALSSSVRISSEFGIRKHPFLKKQMMHNGIDFAAPINTPVFAAADGKVVFLETSHVDGKGHGKYIVIAHSNDYQTIYTQLHGYNAGMGNRVKQGDVIGYVGQTGISTGPHLHFEIVKNGQHLDPMLFLK